MDKELFELQETICKKYNAAFRDAEAGKVIGVADNIKDGLLPINGLRHPTTETTTGWFIWGGGEPSSNPRFFKPMHVEHFIKYYPHIVPYLGLAPGWRFMIDPNSNYEDVWRDESLLEAED